MGVATGCCCKKVYRFPHATYPYSSCILFFFAAATFCSFQKMCFKKKKKNAKSRFLTSRGAYVNLHYIAMLLLLFLIMTQKYKQDMPN